ncbi:MAG TPA: hypothetical protein VLX92_25005, partial [Kofleriaceae bacterium]|nr:hypothetical protein [Kofleriaceae bacterium]
GTGGSSTSTAEGLDIGGAYGITDKITAGASYQFTLNDDSGSFPNNGKGPLDVYGSYSIMHTAKLNVAVGADLVADFGASDAMGSTTNFAVDAGIAVRYAVIPQVAVYTGSPMLPGPVGQQLTLGLNNNQEGKLQLPVGVGVQALPQLFAFAQTSLFEVLVANAPMGADSFSAIGSNQFGIPLLAGAYYNVNKILDIGAFVNFPDLNHAGDLYDIGVGARWYK